MAIQVTMHVFSGRPDPTWILDSRQTDDLMDIIRAANTPTNTKALGAFGNLGYRGFSVEGTLPLDFGAQSRSFSLFTNEGVLDHGASFPSYLESQPTIEKYLLDTGIKHLHPDVASVVQNSLTQPPSPQSFSPQMFNAPATQCPTSVAADAPVYDPGKWNIPSVQPYNNCYAYANDQITNTFPQPGRATGKPITGLSCGGVQPSAVSDGLRATSGFNTPLASGEGWYAALVIWPGQDYHWYRQDTVGCWSHKPGQTAARNTDNRGRPIADPATAARGPYTDFCTYMVTNRRVTIR
ncbi:MAG TPA: hypothetical protein VEZ71_01705 [Archangium sp.]|nr:hypothetical protein [Archangium sp.]